MLALVVGYALLVPMLDGRTETGMAYDAVRLPPSGEHPFGTGSLGRDLWVLTAHGLRLSLTIAAVCAITSTLLGLALGGLFGIAGGWVDRIGMRVVDALSAVPHLLLGIVIVALFRGSPAAIIASITITHWTSVARVVRAELLSLREREFVDAAIASGATRWQLGRDHLIPAVAPQAGLAAVLLLPHAVWHESALSFLGLGLPPHTPSVGTLLADAQATLMLGAWWTLVFPAAALVVTTLAVAGLGAALRDRVTPRRRTEALL